MSGRRIGPISYSNETARWADRSRAGLQVDVQGSYNAQNQFVANTIKFNGNACITLSKFKRASLPWSSSNRCNPHWIRSQVFVLVGFGEAILQLRTVASLQRHSNHCHARKRANPSNAQQLAMCRHVKFANPFCCSLTTSGHSHPLLKITTMVTYC
jgi:hypothetical protein